MWRWIRKRLRTVTTSIIRWLHAQLDTFRQPEGILRLDDMVGMVSKIQHETIVRPPFKRIFDEFDSQIRIYRYDILVCIWRQAWRGRILTRSISAMKRMLANSGPKWGTVWR
jgi:hypothetical protein